MRAGPRLMRMGRNPSRLSKPSMRSCCWGSGRGAALFDAGFIFAGNPENAVTPQLKAVVMACPSSWSEIPIDGVWSLAVSRITCQADYDPLDRFMPARNVVVRVFQRRWPSCATVARANGFPLITKHSGSWDWAKTCEPCKAEQMSIANSSCHTSSASEVDRHDASQRSKRLTTRCDKRQETRRLNTPPANWPSKMIQLGPVLLALLR